MMIKFAVILATAFLPLAISGCSDDAAIPGGDNVTETRMDDVDVIDGTISDDMIDLDAVKENDALVAEAEPAKPGAQTKKNSGSSPVEDISSDTATPEDDKPAE